MATQENWLLRHSLQTSEDPDMTLLVFWISRLRDQNFVEQYFVSNARHAELDPLLDDALKEAGSLDRKEFAKAIYAGKAHADGSLCEIVRTYAETIRKRWTDMDAYRTEVRRILQLHAEIVADDNKLLNELLQCR